MNDYDFTKLKQYLEHEFIEPDEAITALELIEESVRECEKMFILNPALTKSLLVLGKVIEYIFDAIPEEKKK